MGETATVVSTGCGPLGSNRSYLESLRSQPTMLKIDDPYAVQLLAHVQALDQR
jgi:cation transport regulator ChaC